jgi:hypothetical protein
MSRVLVKFSSDWADEFTAEGIAIMSSEEWEKLRERVKDPITWNFGTNEGWEDELLDDSFTVTEITDEEAETLQRLIPDLVVRTQTFEYEGKPYQFTSGGNFGIIPTLSALAEYEEEEEENED